MSRGSGAVLGDNPDFRRAYVVESDPTVPIPADNLSSALSFLLTSAGRLQTAAELINVPRLLLKQWTSSF